MEQGGQLPPEILQVETFREGALVFFRAFFTDPNNDAEGFGFRGANGSLWAEEEHPFSDPSFGRVSPGIIEYPFNHGCGTGSEIESDVEVWIYDSAGLVSQSVTVHLACDEAGQPPPGQSGQPEGKAPNLIVYVHGCCTNEDDVNELRVQFSEAYKGKDFLIKNGGWEIVVWDWHDHTPKPPGVIDQLAIQSYANRAYTYARDFGGRELADAIGLFSIYQYVHLIAHSAGAVLIDVAAKELKLDYLEIPNQEERPFIHLTFLDAYTDSDADKHAYGFLSGYPKEKHFVEHYVDIGLWYTDACLPYAFNFNITDWIPGKDTSEFGHRWPRIWYERSITFSPPVDPTIPGFAYGYQLSLEGSDKDINELVNEMANYPAGQQCPVSVEGARCEPTACW